MFSIISSIKPYFFSLREVGNNVSLDIKIPVTWKIETISDLSKSKGVNVKIQDKNSSNALISLISESTKDGYDSVVDVAKTIIKTNLEEEEKNRLFELKVQELKRVFSEEPLNKLKEISFTKANVRNRKSTGEVKLGDREGFNSDTENEGEVDS